MFILSKNKFLIPRENSDSYVIPKDYIGEIPEDIADHWLIQAAVQSGMIATPQGSKDKQLEAADEAAADKVDTADIRPDAKEDLAEEDEKAAGKRNSKK